MIFDTLLFPLLENAALLLALVALHELFSERLASPRNRGAQILLGLVTGLLTIGLMLLPLRYAPGIIFDTRSVLISLSGLFFGIVPTVIAMAVASAYRFYLGGIAAWTGVCVILASGMIGLLWHHFRSRPLEQLRWPELYAFGLVVHAVMMVLMLILPGTAALEVIADMGILVMLLFPLLSTLTGMLLVNYLRRRRVGEQLRENHELLRLALWASNQALFDIDVEREEIVAQADKDLAGHQVFGDFRLTLQEWLRSLHDEDRPRIEEIYQRCRQGEIEQFQVELRQRDPETGGWTWKLASGNVQTRESGRHVVGSLIDIMARKRTNWRRSRRKRRSGGRPTTTA